MYFENASGKDIVVINTERPNKEPIYIPMGTVHMESWVEGGGDTYGPFHYAWNVDVIFNDERIINYDVYSNRFAFNNPLYWENYKKDTVRYDKHYKEYEYYYTFVPEQYDMAEPYNPNEPEPED